jgi:hypothetical protein
MEWEALVIIGMSVCNAIVIIICAIIFNRRVNKISFDSKYPRKEVTYNILSQLKLTDEQMPSKSDYFFNMGLAWFSGFILWIVLLGFSTNQPGTWFICFVDILLLLGPYIYSRQIFKVLKGFNSNINIYHNGDSNENKLLSCEIRPSAPIPLDNPPNCRRKNNKIQNDNKDNPERSVHKHAPSCGSNVLSDSNHSIAGGAPEKDIEDKS